MHITRILAFSPSHMQRYILQEVAEEEAKVVKFEIHYTPWLYFKLTSLKVVT